MKICYVSLFLDLNRENWKTFKRTFTDYLNSFEPFITMFSKDEKCEYEMVLFLDKKHVSTVRNKFNKHTKIKIIEIDREYLLLNFPMWKTLPREQEIMESDPFKKLVQHRIQCPETHNPEYTLINHCKIDAVVKAMEHSDANLFAWVDFGYFASPDRIPKNFIDVTKLNCNTINYTLINPITPDDYNVIKTIQTATEKVCGYFFFGEKQVLKSYQNLYHRVLDVFQKNNVADDDQHVVLHCQNNNPSMFTFHHLAKWHVALIHFCKAETAQEKSEKQETPQVTPLCEIMNRHGSDKGSGHHNYTKLYHQLFKEKRNESLNILEIGIGSVNPTVPSNMCGNVEYSPGSSIRGWHEYFPNSRIYACDIDRNILSFPEERITGFYLDQTNISEAAKIFLSNNIYYDIIIDDGLHLFSANWNLLGLLRQRLKPDGFYIIEDIVDYDSKLTAGVKSCRYIQIPNPKNTADNNILIYSKNIDNLDLNLNMYL